jgi:hypothetical protein
MKAGTSNFGYIKFGNASEEHISAVFDLSDGTVGDTDTGTVSGTVVSTSCTPVGNGWYRCVLIGSVNETSSNHGIGIAPAKTGNTFNNFGNIIGTTTNTILIWGAQMELGSFPTSYIPTTTATVTRALDNVQMAASAMPFLSTASTIFVEYGSAVSADQLAIIFGLDDASTNFNNSTNISQSNSDNSVAGNYTYAAMYTGTAQYGQNHGLTTATDLKVHRAALTFTANSANSSVDGSSHADDTAVTMPSSTTRVDVGSRGGTLTWTGHIRKVAYLPRREANANIQKITRVSP